MTGRDAENAPADRLVEALLRVMPGDDAERPRWLRLHARAIGVHPDTLERWCYGETKPEFNHVFALCDHFGPDFEAEVRGTARRRSNRELIDAIMRDVHRLADAPPDVSPTKASGRGADRDGGQ